MVPAVRRELDPMGRGWRPELCQSEGANKPHLEETMPAAASLSERPAAIRVDLGAIFVSMELSRSNG
jgi:hypothetical protein